MLLPPPPIVLPILTPSKLGRIWEIIVRNYFANKGYIVFRCFGSGPPCDLIAFRPPEGFDRIPFPKRHIIRSMSIENKVRMEYCKRFGYIPELVPRVFNGIYKKGNSLTSIVVHLIAFGSDYFRLIWVRPRTKHKARRSWDRKIKDTGWLTFIECKAGKYLDPKQHLEQMGYAKKARTDYITIQKTTEGALVKTHYLKMAGPTPDPKSGAYIVKWKDLLLLGEMGNV